MKVITITLTAVLLLLLFDVCAHAGEDDSWVGGSGLPVPIKPTYSVEVTAARLQITFPSEITKYHGWVPTIRSEYDLKFESSKDDPVLAEFGFPIVYQGLRYNHDPLNDGDVPTVYVKLDGEPVPARFLNFNDLARPLVEQWQEKIDRLLKEHPALEKEVMSTRAAIQATGPRAEHPAIGDLYRWLRDHFAEEELPRHEIRSIVTGLLGISTDYPHRPDYTVQAALAWLDPDHEKMDMYEQLRQQLRVGFLLLNPANGQLLDARDITDRPVFGAFQFQVSLAPNVQHKLVVQHQQRLGFHPGFYGLHYALITPYWGRWRKTSIEVRFPEGARSIAIRPPAGEVTQEDGMSVYRIEMGRPVEDLYVSALPPSKKN